MEPLTSLPPISESDRRLLELARAHRSDAALAVQFGVLTGEVQRRLDTIAGALGLSSRQALREIDPASLEIAPAAMETPAAAIAMPRPGLRFDGPAEAGVPDTRVASPPPPRAGRGRRALGWFNAIFGLLGLIGLAWIMARSGESPPVVNQPGTGASPLNTIMQAAIVAPHRIARLDIASPMPEGVEVLAIVEHSTGTQELVRIWRPRGGGTQMNTLLSPAEGSELTSALPSDTRGELWATVCTSCDDAGTRTTTALRSIDGGVTWTEEVTVAGRAILQEARSGAATLATEAPVSLRGHSEAPSGTLARSSSFALAVEAAGATVTHANVVTRPGMPDVILASWVDGDHRLTGVFRGEGSAAGDALATWRVPAFTVMAGFIYGTGGRPVLSIPPGIGAMDTETAPGIRALRPVVLDFDLGIIKPIALPAALGISDHTSVRPIAVREGELWPLVSASGCIDIKESPRLDAPSVACLADGTLVSLMINADDAPGWQPLVTPAGDRGWMNIAPPGATASN